MHYDAKITSKGQLTLPADLRRALGVEPGHHVRFVVNEDGSVSVRKSAEGFEDLRGIVKLGRSVTTEDINRWVGEARAAIGGAER